MGVTFVAWIAPKGGGKTPPHARPWRALTSPAGSQETPFSYEKGRGHHGEPVGTPPRPLRGALLHTWPGRAATWEGQRASPPRPLEAPLAAIGLSQRGELQNHTLGELSPRKGLLRGP